MKKIVLFCLFVFAGLAVQAQDAKTCSKSDSKKCCASKAKAATTASAATIPNAKFAAMADRAAESDENVERRQCATSGKVAYYQKSVCSASGKVSYDEVQYDTEKLQFVNVSPSAMQAEKEAKSVEMSGKEGAATSAKKSCSKTCAKTCTKGKATTASNE